MRMILVAFGVAALLAAAPIQATTFPALTTIYVASGVFDSGGAENTGAVTSVHCSNVSGQNAQLRFLFLQINGAVVGNLTHSLPHGETVTASTRGTVYFADTEVSTGAINQGVVNVESTQSAVFCSAMIVGAAGPIPNGIALHMVRVNPHPGTVE